MSFTTLKSGKYIAGPIGTDPSKYTVYYNLNVTPDGKSYSFSGDYGQGNGKLETIAGFGTQVEGEIAGWGKGLGVLSTTDANTIIWGNSTQWVLQ